MPSSLQHILKIRHFAIKEEYLRCWRNCTNDIKKAVLSFLLFKKYCRVLKKVQTVILLCCSYIHRLTEGVRFSPSRFTTLFNAQNR